LVLKGQFEPIKDLKINTKYIQIEKTISHNLN